MKIKIYGIIILLAFFLTPSVYASTPIDEAMNAYKSKGLEAFLPAIIKGSPMEDDKNVMVQGNNIKQIETFFGSFESYDYVYEKPLNNRTKIVYIIMNYENGPVYLSATLYKKKNGYIVSAFNFHTEMKHVFPPEVVFK